MEEKIVSWLLTQGWFGIIVIILGYAVYTLWGQFKSTLADKDAQLAAAQKDAQARIDAANDKVIAAEARRTADANAKADEMTGFAKSNQAVISQLVEELKKAA